MQEGQSAFRFKHAIGAAAPRFSEAMKWTAFGGRDRFGIRPATAYSRPSSSSQRANILNGITRPASAWHAKAREKIRSANSHRAARCRPNTPNSLGQASSGVGMACEIFTKLRKVPPPSCP